MHALAATQPTPPIVGGGGEHRRPGFTGGKRYITPTDARRCRQVIFLVGATEIKIFFYFPNRIPYRYDSNLHFRHLIIISILIDALHAT